MNTLTIRYANPDTTPGRYPSAGWIKADMIMDGDYWTVRGDEYHLRRHLTAALSDNNVNDYQLARS